MTTRLALAPVLLVLAAACTGSPVAQSPSPSTALPMPVPTLPEADSEVDPNGNVIGAYPELSVQSTEDGRSLAIEVADPAARAWRVVVSATGTADRDRLEIVVETGDVGPSVIVSLYVGGDLVDEADLTGLADDPTAAAGGCHPTISVCYASGDLRLPADGDGVFGVVLSLEPPDAAISIVGGTAMWPREPFILGPWTETRPYDATAS